jgi:hypothetical protein
LADYAIHFPPNLLKNYRFGGLCCSFSAKSEKAPSAKPTYGGGFVLKNFAVSEIKNIFAKKLPKLLWRQTLVGYNVIPIITKPALC